MKPLNIFYEEPDPDRWLPYDRHPRKIIRRILRGKQQPGGVMMVALNLMEGLSKLGQTYRFNDYKYISKNPQETACIIGKPHLLFTRKWQNPIVFGAGVFSHPSDEPDLLQRIPNIKKILVPGPWMVEMFSAHYGNIVQAWPTGIDTEAWLPVVKSSDKEIDFLIYKKIRWDKETYNAELVNPILTILKKQGLSHHIIQYGNYSHADLKAVLKKTKAVIFLCEHESQGLAYQQILSSGVPILAWDRGGYWQDPNYYPQIKFGPVSSVPYWDNTCGLKFTGITDFEAQLAGFINLEKSGRFSPREFILKNLSLEKCAADYLKIVQDIEETVS